MKKKERREEKGDEKRERERKYHIRERRIIESNREIIETKFTKISIAQQTDMHAYIHIRTQVEKHGKTRRRFLESNAREFIIFPMIRVIRADSL